MLSRPLKHHAMSSRSARRLAYVSLAMRLPTCLRTRLRGSSRPRFCRLLKRSRASMAEGFRPRRLPFSSSLSSTWTGSGAKGVLPSFGGASACFSSLLICDAGERKNHLWRDRRGHACHVA